MADDRRRKPGDLDVEVGKRIKALRNLRGMTQPDLAAFLNISFQQLQRYEYGANRAPPVVIRDLCKGLGCTPNDLIPCDGITPRGDLLEADETELILAYRQMGQSERNALLLLAKGCCSDGKRLVKSMSYDGERLVR